MGQATLATVLVAALLSACASSSGRTYFQGSTGSAYFVRHDDGPVLVAFYRDGRVHGAEVAHDDDSPFHEWFGEAPVLDHPQLGEWQRQLEDIQHTAAEPSATARQFVAAARGFPFDDAIEDALRSWWGDDPVRAAALLDEGDHLDVGRTFLEEVATCALRETVEDSRRAEWVRKLLDDHDETVRLLVESAPVEPATARVVLANLDELPSSDRLAVLEVVARELAGDPAFARLLIDAVEELPSRDEAEAVIRMLEGHASPQLVREVLRTIDDRKSSTRAELFARAAALGRADPGNHLVIASALGDLPSARRLEAASGLVTRGDVSVELTRVLVEAVDELPSRDREAFLLAVLDGPHGSVEMIRDACRAAAESNLQRRARARVLERIG